MMQVGEAVAEAKLLPQPQDSRGHSEEKPHVGIFYMTSKLTMGQKVCKKLVELLGNLVELFENPVELLENPVELPQNPVEI